MFNNSIMLCGLLLALAALLPGCGGGASSGGTVSVPTVEFSANPTSITSGQGTTLTWTSTNGSSATIDNGVGAVAVSGTTSVSPAQTTTYKITVTGAGGSTTATATVTVLQPPGLSFAASPPAITVGQSTKLAWTSTNATSATIDNGVGTVALNGSVNVSPAQMTIYTLTATGAGGITTAKATVTVSPAPIVSITANPAAIIAGQSSTLTVTAANATKVVVTDNVDANIYTLATAGGNQSVSPEITATYTVTATGVNESTTTAAVTINVTPALIGLVPFRGIGWADVPAPGFNVDPNGAVGTKQFMEYVNVAYQAYDKVTFAPVWPAAQALTTLWPASGHCSNITGDGIVIFDRLASRWVIGAHTSIPNQYYYCIAVSNTDDLSSSTLAWYAYEINLDPILGTNTQGHVYFPDWPKLGTWPDAYYLALDMNDIDQNDREVGVVTCALDRANMLLGLTPRSQQCFVTTSPLNNGVYISHSLIPADVEGTTPPPAGRDEYFVSIQNPPLDGLTKTSNSINLWDFHLDWVTPSNSTFTQISEPVSPYTPGCYNPVTPVNTFCVPEPSSSSTGKYVDSVGDRMMPRLAYRNFGSYESFLFGHTVQPGTNQQTGIRWYEFRGSGSGNPSIYQENTLSPDSSLYRFVPSLAQDKNGNAAVGYSVSSATSDPGINAAWWNLPNPNAPAEVSIISGSGDEENTSKWGSYTSMTVDPVDDCTFWYVDEYFPTSQTGSLFTWQTEIAKFKISDCQ